MPASFLRRFFLPTLNKRYFIRLGLIALGSYLLFGYLLIPLRLQGVSMEPTYRDGTYAFSWRLRYALAPMERFDVVTVRYSGRRVMLLKRIVALPGETVEFRKGFLYVDGKPIDEPYVHHRAAWELASRTVSPGHVYVVGDNRGTPMDRHQFGETPMHRIVGGVFP